MNIKERIAKLRPKARSTRPVQQAKRKKPKPEAAPRQRRTKPAEKLWADQYMEERGFDREFAEQNGAEIERDRIVFIKFHPLTGLRVEGSRTRLREPITIKGKPAKFIQRKDTNSSPYFARCLNWKSIFADPSCPIVISEGETRSLAGAKHHIPVIGCGGVDGVFMAGTHRQKLHPIFEEMVLKGRTIYICFDADAESNSNVRNAENAAAKLFVEAAR
jgi:hypothetical protein